MGYGIEEKKKHMVKIAVFPASSEVGMEIIRCLSDVRGIEVWAVDSVDGPAKFICGNYINNAPYCKDPDLTNFFDGFDYVYPANDEALWDFRDIQKAICHHWKTITMCHFKSTLYNSLREIVPCPEVYPETTWSKPDHGHSGIGQYIVETPNLHTEYLPGEEITVDVFTGKDREVIYCSTRKRSRIMGGVAVETEAISTPIEILGYIENINKSLEFSGAWFAQFKQDWLDQYKLLEVGARISGSSGINRASGVNLPLLNYYLKAGIDFKITHGKPSSIKRYLTVRSEFPEIKILYVDYDDCLMINGKINWKIMALVYKLNIECHILTAGENAELIHPLKSVIFEKEKSKYSKPDTMLIDDSFRERASWINAISPQQIDLYL